MIPVPVRNKLLELVNVSAGGEWIKHACQGRLVVEELHRLTVPSQRVIDLIRRSV